MVAKTKIVCTIGPKTQSFESIIALIQAGMNVARINFSHGSYEAHAKTIETLKRARETLRRPLAIMLDTKGPEIRLGEIQGGEIHVNAKDRLLLVRDTLQKEPHQVPIIPPFVLDSVSNNSTILFNDGYISSHVVEISEKGVYVEIDNAGILSSGKGVNMPGTSIELPNLTKRDIEDITFGCKEDIDMIAASFICTADNVVAIQNLLKENGKSDIPIIAKIESQQGVENFDDILAVADGIMIARGDLGVEVPLSQVPQLQKMMIRKCYFAGKPAITATQMLESMITNPRPTRAEVSDVANAVYDSTSALMLSAETAVGEYPIESVRVMQKVSQVAERDTDFRVFIEKHGQNIYHDVSSAVAFSSVNTAYHVDARAIFVFTSTGYTPRLVSRLRPAMPVIALTDSMRIYHQLSLNWGIIPLFNEKFETIAQALKIVSDFALQKGIVHVGDRVVLTAGAPFGISGTTNMMIVETINEN